LIDDDHSRDIRQALKQFAQASLRRRFVPPLLHQDIKGLAVLIDGMP
jgi:hypothetical protein